MNVKFGNLTGGKGSTVEKNLDTQLCTDLVKGAALGTFDVAILVTNDGDFVSAITTAKEFGKGVELVFFKNGLSMALKQVADITRRARRIFFQKLRF